MDNGFKSSSTTKHQSSRGTLLNKEKNNPALASNHDGTILSGVLNGRVYLYSFKLSKSIWIGNMDTISQNDFVSLQIVRDRYIFAGMMRHSVNRCFKVWEFVISDKNIQFKLIFPVQIHLKDAKVRGFGCVMALPNSNSYRIACGIGIGKAHVFTFDSSLLPSEAAIQYEGSLQSKSNSIGAMAFSDDARYLVTIGDGEIYQCWDISSLKQQSASSTFEGKSSNSQLISKDDLRILSTFVASDLQRRYDGYANPSMVKDIVSIPSTSSKQNVWKLLFPKWMIDRDAYDGHLDAQKKPHGYGSKYIDSDSKAQALIYFGNWEHGKRTGLGEIRDAETNELLFSGYFKDDVKHGIGSEFTLYEVYQGSFEKNERHGLGKLITLLTARDDEDDDEERSVNVPVPKIKRIFVGFFKQGATSGIGYQIFPNSVATMWSAVNCETNRIINPHTDNLNVCWFCLNKSQNISGHAFGCNLCGFACHRECLKKINNNQQLLCPFANYECCKSQQNLESIIIQAHSSISVEIVNENSASNASMASEDDVQLSSLIDLGPSNVSNVRKEQLKEQRQREKSGKRAATVLFEEYERSMLQLHRESLAKHLSEERAGEMSRRRQWKKQKEEKEAEIMHLESEKQNLSNQVVLSTRNLDDLLGRNLNGKTYAELCEMQTTIENLIQKFISGA